MSHTCVTLLKPGKPCSYKAKIGCEFCGIHQHKIKIRTTSTDREVVEPLEEEIESIEPKKLVIKRKKAVRHSGIKTVDEFLMEDPGRSVWSVILEQNRYDKNLLIRALDGEITKKEFKELSSERLKGQWNWGMESFNIRLSKYLCKHSCTYCYIGPMFKRWGRICETPDIEDLMPTDPKLVRKSWTKASSMGRKVIFPIFI